VLVQTPAMSSQRTGKLKPVASLVGVNHLRVRTGLVGPVSV